MGVVTIVHDLCDKYNNAEVILYLLFYEINAPLFSLPG